MQEVNKLYEKFITALYAQNDLKAAEIVKSHPTLKDKFFRFSLNEYEIDGIYFLLKDITLTKGDLQQAEKLGYRNHQGFKDDAYYAIYLDMQKQYSAQQKAASKVTIKPEEVIPRSVNKPGCH